MLDMYRVLRYNIQEVISMKKTLSIRIDENLKKILAEISKKNKRSITGQIEYWISKEQTFGGIKK